MTFQTNDSHNKKMIERICRNFTLSLLVNISQDVQKTSDSSVRGRRPKKYQESKKLPHYSLITVTSFVFEIFSYKYTLKLF